MKEFNISVPETKGYIHSFESFGTLDGPGIRFVIFFQGCPLKCKYCHNRDTWQPNVGQSYTKEEILEKVLRFQPYFKSSNGGVTLSGGDPLLQQDFVLELLKELKKHKIHTALDTSGCFKITPKVEEILKYTDLVLLDIKHIDDEKCKELTGVSNKLELEFAQYLSDHNIPVWIRQVIVPTITDDENDLKRLKEFLSSLKNVQRIDLLAYEDLGKFKWESLNVPYPLEGVRLANFNDIQRAKEILNIEEIIDQNIQNAKK